VTERSSYTNGVLDGELLRYDKNGKVQEKILYKNGKPQ
jgi:antitoxin component YwqK of YwqJK toxin-antitoxin module